MAHLGDNDLSWLNKPQFPENRTLTARSGDVNAVSKSRAWWGRGFLLSTTQFWLNKFFKNPPPPRSLLRSIPLPSCKNSIVGQVIRYWIHSLQMSVGNDVSSRYFFHVAPCLLLSSAFTLSLPVLIALSLYVFFFLNTVNGMNYLFPSISLHLVMRTWKSCPRSLFLHGNKT